MDAMNPDPVLVKLKDAFVRALPKSTLHNQDDVLIEFEDISESCLTLANNGSRIYYNRSFIDNMSQDDLDALALHELHYIAYVRSQST